MSSSFGPTNNNIPILRQNEHPLLKLGLTGGIASGKSVVGEIFVKLGAHLIQADAVAHSLMQPGCTVYAEVVRRFGREILNPDGSINRPRLAEAAFGSPGGAPPRFKELNEIVHPAVIDHENQWMEEISRREVCPPPWNFGRRRSCRSRSAHGGTDPRRRKSQSRRFRNRQLRIPRCNRAAGAPRFRRTALSSLITSKFVW